MARPHPAIDYESFEAYVANLIEHLFVGFRLHKKQHWWPTVRKRPDFSLIRISNHRERLVVDAKFYHGRLTLRDVKKVQKYKGFPFMARHAALVFPANCDVQASALQFAQEKHVMLVRLSARKAIRYKFTMKWLAIPWIKAVGFKVDGDSLLSPEQLAQSAQWIAGPFYER